MDYVNEKSIVSVAVDYLVMTFFYLFPAVVCVGLMVR